MPVDFRCGIGTAVKLLCYDGQGFWLCHKHRELLAHELAVLLAGGDPERTHAAPQWRPVTPALQAKSEPSREHEDTKGD